MSGHSAENERQHRIVDRLLAVVVVLLPLFFWWLSTFPDV